ncbi:uncharacterized protein J3R85_018680 [Psidium guajava]|nr:uncharacterized protein J3R85_018680 [Psidium guajava]
MASWEQYNFQQDPNPSPPPLHPRQSLPVLIFPHRRSFNPRQDLIKPAIFCRFGGRTAKCPSAPISGRDPIASVTHGAGSALAKPSRHVLQQG